MSLLVDFSQEEVVVDEAERYIKGYKPLPLFK
jgi:hypothetical protein